MTSNMIATPKLHTSIHFAIQCFVYELVLHLPRSPQLSLREVNDTARNLCSLQDNDTIQVYLLTSPSTRTTNLKNIVRFDAHVSLSIS